MSTNWIIGEGRERRRFFWGAIWPNNYWFVKYYIKGQEDESSPKRFRVRVQYRDGVDMCMNSLLPWAQKASPHN